MGRLLGNGAKPCENLLREDDNKVDSRSNLGAPNGMGGAKEICVRQRKGVERQGMPAEKRRGRE